VDAAVESNRRGQSNAAMNQLGALVRETEAQRGSHVSERAARLLTGDARYVQPHLR
jgi:hypothetical protein